MLHPLPQDSGQARRHAGGGSARTQPADDAQPCADRLMQQCAVTVNQRLLLHRYPNIGWIAAQCVAKKSGRSHADDGEGMPLDNESRAHHRRIGSIICLPGLMADHGHRRGGRLVVLGRKQTAAERPYAQRREIVARDVLGPQRFGRDGGALPPHAQTVAAGLKGSHFFEFRRRCFQTLVQRKGIHSPALLRAAFHAAIVAVADPIEERRIGNRQRAQHHRVDQSEDRGSAADSQGQRQDGGGRKYRRQPELPQSVAESAKQYSAFEPLNPYEIQDAKFHKKYRNFWPRRTVKVSFVDRTGGHRRGVLMIQLEAAD